MIHFAEKEPDYNEALIRSQIESLKRTKLAIEGQITQIESQRTHDKSRERDATLEMLLDEQRGMLKDTEGEIKRLEIDLAMIKPKEGMQLGG